MRMNTDDTRSCLSWLIGDRRHRTCKETLKDASNRWVIDVGKKNITFSYQPIMTHVSSPLVQEAKRNINNAIVEQYNEFLNTALFKEFGLTVRAVTSDSMIDGEYIYFAPIDNARFIAEFDRIVRVVKESLSIDLFKTDLEKTTIPYNGQNIETELYYIQFPKDIQDMEEFNYNQFKEIYRQVMVGKTMDGAIKIIENIENKVVVVYGPHESGVTNLKSVLENEISEKHKKTAFYDVVSLKDA